MELNARDDKIAKDEQTQRLQAKGGKFRHYMLHLQRKLYSFLLPVFALSLLFTAETAKSSPYVPYIIVGMLVFLLVVYFFDEYASSLAITDTAATCNKNWFNIVNAVVMVIIAALTTLVNTTVGHSIGENLLRHQKVEAGDLKDSVKTMLESTGLVNALIFASAVALCTNGSPTGGCGFIDQMYYNFAFNALGASFYGIICAVAPLMYLPALGPDEFLEYIQDRNNLRGLGASVITTVMSGVETVTACVLYGWAVYGRTMGVSLWVGVAFLFVGTVNKFHYQSVWRVK